MASQLEKVVQNNVNDQQMYVLLGKFSSFEDASTFASEVQGLVGSFISRSAKLDMLPTTICRRLLAAVVTSIL